MDQNRDKNFKILAINPGSTSTKIGIFENEDLIFEKTLTHDPSVLKSFENIIDQYEYRRKLVVSAFLKTGIEASEVDIVMARGGLLKPLASGVYQVNELMLSELRASKYGEHASNLGSLIASDIVPYCRPDVKAYIADPVVVDELQDVARIAGHPLFSRTSVFHALNQKAMARRYAVSVNKKYEDINVIVAHLGGGISVGSHCKGQIVDVNNALDGEGPLSPERSGCLPSGQVVSMAFSGQYTKQQMQHMIVGQGGLMGYFGTNNAYDIYVKAEKGDAECKLILDAMAYQTAKSIGAAASVLKGDVQAIILTGGIANNDYICHYIEGMVSFIADIKRFPGEDELGALANNGLMLLRGDVEAKEYV